MRGTVLIEVDSKEGVADPVGRGLEASCKSAKIKVGTIQASQLYRLVGDLSADQVQTIGKDLLTDPIIQEFHDGATRRPGATTIDVCFKDGVTDAVGDSVMKGLQDLGIESVKQVRTGMRYRLEGVRKAEIGKKVALSFLANPLVQEIFVYVD
jgi:phosphoribosylformylglycinamidine (FGAM) synthase PurS component